MQLPDLGDDLVEEVAVVADDDHRHRLPRQVVLEPLGRLDVEVVRGLVQEHQVGALQQQLGEHQPRLLAAGERRRRAVEVGLGEAEAGEDLLDAMVDRVGVLVLELVVQLVVAPARPGRGRPRPRPRPSPARPPRARAGGRCSEASPDWATSISVSSGRSRAAAGAG